MDIFCIIVFFRLFLSHVVHCNRRELPKTCVYIEYQTKELNVSDIGCPNNEICKRNFRISYINLHPYDSEELKCIEEILTKCCGTCAKYEVINNFSNITEVTPSLINSSDFIFPFLASATTKELHGFYFLPYINAPIALYITRRDEEIMLFKSILRLYPLIIICLLLAFVSGFIAWIIETWSNEEQFPRPFIIGWFEGVWWSFISMTTVGYGDKTPKSILARVFSVIWILTGIVVFGIFSGELTTSIIQLNSPPPADMKDALVGALWYRDYDVYVISQHGGNVRRNEDATNFTSDLIQLITKLEERKIDGFLLDKWTLYYATYILNATSYSTEDIHLINTITFFMKNTIRAEKSYKGEKLTYGILVKHTEDYEYFKDFIQASRLGIEIEGALLWTMVQKEIKEQNAGTFYSTSSNILFSPSKHYFLYSTIVISAMIGIIVLFGIFYELNRKSNKTVRSKEKFLFV